MNQVGVYVGRVKSYNSKKGYGFIDCPAARAVYGRDVFIHKAQMGELLGRFVGPGTRLDPKCLHMHVQFSVGSNREGMPQARDVIRIDVPEEAEFSAHGFVPPRVMAPSPEVLNPMLGLGGDPQGVGVNRSSNGEPRSYRGRGGTIRLLHNQEEELASAASGAYVGSLGVAETDFRRRAPQGNTSASYQSKDRRPNRKGARGGMASGGFMQEPASDWSRIAQEDCRSAPFRPMSPDTGLCDGSCHSEDLRRRSKDFGGYRPLQQPQQPQQQQQQPQQQTTPFIGNAIYPQLFGGPALAQPMSLPSFSPCAGGARPESPSSPAYGVIPSSPDQYAAVMTPPPPPYPAYLPQAAFQANQPETPQSGSPPSPLHLTAQDLPPLPAQQSASLPQAVTAQQPRPQQAQQPLQLPLPPHQSQQQRQQQQYLLQYQQALMGPAQMVPPQHLHWHLQASSSRMYPLQMGVPDGAGTPTSRQSFGLGGLPGTEDNPRTAPSTPDAVSPVGSDSPEVRPQPLSPLYVNNGLGQPSFPNFGGLGNMPSPIWQRMDSVGLDQQVQQSVSHSL